jgi:hypothetical protein
MNRIFTLQAGRPRSSSSADWQMDPALLGIRLLFVENKRVADHANPQRIRLSCKVRGKRFFLFLFFEAEESDLDQLMAQKTVVNRLDHPCHEPFFSDLDNWFEIMG